MVSKHVQYACSVVLCKMYLMYLNRNFLLQNVRFHFFCISTTLVFLFKIDCTLQASSFKKILSWKRKETTKTIKSIYQTSTVREPIQIFISNAIKAKNDDVLEIQAVYEPLETKLLSTSTSIINDNTTFVNTLSNVGCSRAKNNH